MPSTYSPNLRIELIASGEQANTWGITTNTNLGTLIEEAISGIATIDVTAGDVTLTALNGVTDQSRQMFLNVTGTPSSTRQLVAPEVSKLYFVVNDSTTAIEIVTSAAGSVGVEVPIGVAKAVFSDGVDFFYADDAVISTASRAVVSDTDGVLVASTTTATEIGYVSGVTSALQTQLNAKQATITGAATSITASNLTASRAVVSDSSGKVAASTTTATEIGYVSGVTSAIQTQLNAKQATITGAASTIASSDLTTSRAVVSDSSGKVAASTTTATEIGYVSGVTSAIQTQLNAKAPATSGSSILYGNGSGGFSNVTVGSGLTFSAGTLSTAAGTGTVTSVGVSMPSGFSVSNSPVTGAGTIAVATTLSGVLKGTGSGFTTATSGTDYAPATSGSSILYGNGSGGFSNVIIGANLQFSGGTLAVTANSGTTAVEAITSSSTWTIPAGVSSIRVTVVGGGGGGGSGNYNGGSPYVNTGSDGGTTSISSGSQSISTTSATGGTGGGSALGALGGIGSGGVSFTGDSGGAYYNNTNSFPPTSTGGGSFLGGMTPYGATNGRQYGAGGGGGSTQSTWAGGGGGGGCAIQVYTGLTPGNTLSITIGAGGARAAKGSLISDTYGGNGASGVVVIEY